MIEKKGFTIIELMVVVAIIGILVATSLVNSGKNDDRDLRMEADRLVTFLRDVQNMSLSGEYKNVSGKKVCGFGAYYVDGTPDGFQPFSVVTDGASSLDISCDGGDVAKKNDAGAGSLNEDYGNSFFFKSNDVSVSSASDIFFLIPDAQFFYDGVSGADQTLTLTKGSASVTIEITKTGIISYE